MPSNLIKMVAYQAESDLCRLLAPHYKRHLDEGRTLIQTALASAADIEVSDSELRVTLAPLSSPHRSRAIAAVCRDLDATETVFPGTRLRLRYRVAAGGEPQKADITTSASSGRWAGRRATPMKRGRPRTATRRASGGS